MLSRKETGVWAVGKALRKQRTEQMGNKKHGFHSEKCYMRCRYAGLEALPQDFVERVKKCNPNVMELELSR